MGDNHLTIFIIGLCVRSHKIAVLVANTESGSLCVEECMQTQLHKNGTAQIFSKKSQ